MKRAEPGFENVVIRASAGTGKTFQLANRYLGLVSSGQQPDFILAATFARKAAGEITERVLLRLAEAALDARSGSELAEQLGDKSIPPARWQELLADMVARLHRLRIGTLDSFFIQSASSLSLELSLPPGWTILEDVDDARLRAEAIRRVLAQGSVADSVRVMHMLSKGDAVRSITQQITDLVKDLYDVYRETKEEAWDILPRMTALDRPELSDRLTQLSQLAPCAENKTIANAHAASLESAAAEDWPAFISKGIPAKLAQGETTFSRRPITEEQLAAYGPLVKHARAVLINQWISQTVGARQLLKAFDAEYSQLKFRRRGLRFEDVTRTLAAGLGGRQLSSVFYRLDGQVAHLLLDEFQDTSLTQWQVMEHLARACTEPACGRSFFCVGDVKQAIYGWRGGIAEIFDAVSERLPGIMTHPLNKSFRSSPTVIDVVNRVFESLATNAALVDAPAARDAWARFEPHTTAKQELTGYVCLQTAPREADRKKQGDATLAFAAAEIARLAKKHPGRSIGVLVRRNAAVARLIFDLRTHHQVFASEEGGNPLTDSAAVQLILSLVRLADHPGNGPARFHVATSPLGPLVGFETYDNDDVACQLSERLRRQLQVDGYGRTIYGWVRGLASHCGQRDLNRLLQLVAMAHGYDTRATLRADDFIEYVTARKVEDPTTADVRVMTVHQAKGLQFDVVVLPELDVDLKGQTPRVVIGRPSPTSPATKVCRYAGEELRSLLPEEVQRLFEHWPNQSVSESLCLLYVSMTRAIHALHMIIAPSRENEKTWPKSYAGFLRGALGTDGKAEPERLLYAHGDVNWDDAPRPPAVEPAALKEAAPLEVRLRPSTVRRELERVSPSSLEGAGRVDLKKKLRPPQAAFERGGLIHAWLEAVEWLDDGVPAESILREIACKLRYPETKLPGELKSFAAMLEHGVNRDTLSRATYQQTKSLIWPADIARKLKSAPLRVELFRERRFAVRQGERLLTGAIDRLVQLYHGQRLVAAEIIDFKTDKVDDSAALDERTEFYQPQIDAYRDAVAAMTGLERRRIGTRLLFVESGVCRELVPQNDPGVGPK